LPIGINIKKGKINYKTAKNNEKGNHDKTNPFLIIAIYTE
jgi:hypothetical protein